MSKAPTKRDIPEYSFTVTGRSANVAGLVTTSIAYREGTQFCIMELDPSHGEVHVNGERVIRYRNVCHDKGGPVFDIVQGGAQYLNQSHAELVRRVNLAAEAAI